MGAAIVQARYDAAGCLWQEPHNGNGYRRMSFAGLNGIEARSVTPSSNLYRLVDELVCMAPVRRPVVDRRQRWIER